MSSEALIFEHSDNVTDYVEVDQNLLKSPVIFCAGDIFRNLREQLPMSFHVWRLIKVDSSALIIEVAESETCALRYPPLLTVAVFASADDTLDEASRGAAWLRDHGASVVPEPVVVNPEGSSELTAALASQLVKVLTGQAECITTFSRELASLRIQNESLQNNFRAAEAVLGRKGLQPYELDFVNEPLESHVDVLKEATQKRVAQILPVGSTGVSAVGVHFAEVPSKDSGFLKVQVSSLEDGIVVGTWGVPVSALHTGWNVFGFEKSLAGLPRTLELTITVAGTQNVPCLSLGAPQPIERFRVRDADSARSLTDSSLALQVWTGLAAMALPSWATYWSSKPYTGRGLEMPLRQEAIAPDMLSGVTHYNTDEVSFTFEAVQALVPERAIACHPPAFGMTMARLPGACPAGALRVSACALVDNEKSQEVEFALVTTTDGDRARLLLRGDTAPVLGESFSSWIRVSPATKQAVNAFISQPVARCQDVFIATRMVEAGNNDFAWAKFQDLTAVFQDLT